MPLAPPLRKSSPVRTRRRQAPPAPAWPSFSGSAQYVGSSNNGRVHVFVDTLLGAPALQNAEDLVNDSDRIVALNDGFFGTSQGEVSVLVYALGGLTDGTGGADHMGCDYQSGNAIEVCASYGHSMRVSALFEAELSECNMGSSLCGQSTGEGLSRWCASLVSANALSDFATAPVWAEDGMADFVTQTDPTDTSPDSTGCTMAFVSWLLSQGIPFATIARAMVSLGNGGTLAALFATVTGEAATHAWPMFLSAVNALPFGVTSDDPFGGVAPAPPAPSPAPAPSPTPTGVSLDQVIAWATEGLRQNWPNP